MVIIVRKAVKNKVNFAPTVCHDTAHFFGCLFFRKTYSYESKILTDCDKKACVNSALPGIV